LASGCEPKCSSQAPQGEVIWFEGGEYCEWTTLDRGRIGVQRDQQHRIHAITANRQTKSEAHARVVVDSLAAVLRSLDLSERECAPGSSPAGAVRTWLYQGRSDFLVHVSEITPESGAPRLLTIAVDTPSAFPVTLCR
jgi:hypothetical protein